MSDPCDGCDFTNRVCRNCINGCLRLCGCEQCKTKPVHDPTPRPAFRPHNTDSKSRLCHRCEKRLYQWVSDLLGNTLILDSRIPADYSWDKQGHQKVTGSPALVLLDVAALTDHRTLMDINDDPHEPVYIIGKVTGWANLLAEENNLSSPTDTLAQATNLITTWWQTLTEAEWVGEFYRDIDTIRRLLDSANRVEPHQPRGRCFTCDTKLFQAPGADDVVCRKCSRRYTENEILRLEIQRRRDANIAAMIANKREAMRERDGSAGER